MPWAAGINISSTTHGGLRPNTTQPRQDDRTIVDCWCRFWTVEMCFTHVHLSLFSIFNHIYMILYVYPCVYLVSRQHVAFATFFIHPFTWHGLNWSPTLDTNPKWFVSLVVGPASSPPLKLKITSMGIGSRSIKRSRSVMMAISAWVFLSWTVCSSSGYSCSFRFRIKSSGYVLPPRCFSPRHRFSQVVEGTLASEAAGDPRAESKCEEINKAHLRPSMNPQSCAHVYDCVCIQLVSGWECQGLQKKRWLDIWKDLGVDCARSLSKWFWRFEDVSHQVWTHWWKLDVLALKASETPWPQKKSK